MEKGVPDIDEEEELIKGPDTFAYDDIEKEYSTNPDIIAQVLNNLDNEYDASLAFNALEMNPELVEEESIIEAINQFFTNNPKCIKQIPSIVYDVLKPETMIALSENIDVMAEFKREQPDEYDVFLDILTGVREEEEINELGQRIDNRIGELKRKELVRKKEEYMRLSQNIERNEDTREEL